MHSSLMGMDKKVLAGRIRLVLLRRLGEGVVSGDYPAQRCRRRWRRTSAVPT